MRTEQQQQQPVVPFLLRCADWLSIRIGRLLLGLAIHPSAPLPFLLFFSFSFFFHDKKNVPFRSGIFF
jgi:hypothetical protein